MSRVAWNGGGGLQSGLQRKQHFCAGWSISDSMSQICQWDVQQAKQLCYQLMGVWAGISGLRLHKCRFLLDLGSCSWHSTNPCVWNASGTFVCVGRNGNSCSNERQQMWPAVTVCSGFLMFSVSHQQAITHSFFSTPANVSHLLSHFMLSRKESLTFTLSLSLSTFAAISTHARSANSISLFSF